MVVDALLSDAGKNVEFGEVGDGGVNGRLWWGCVLFCDCLGDSALNMRFAMIPTSNRTTHRCD